MEIARNDAAGAAAKLAKLCPPNNTPPALLARRIAPWFGAAYGSAHVDRRYAHCRILAKPVLREELELLVQELMRSLKPSHHQTLTEKAGSSSFDHRS